MPPITFEVSGLELGRLSDNILAGGLHLGVLRNRRPPAVVLPAVLSAFLALLKAVFGPDSWVPAMQTIQAVPPPPRPC